LLREKMLEFSSMVLTALFPYLLIYNIDATKIIAK